MSKQTMLVTGATGRQGGAAARAALRAGVPVRAMVRNPQSDAAQRLAAAGVELVQGDLGDPASVAAACAGVGSVFSVQQRPTSRGGYGLKGGGEAKALAAAGSVAEIDPEIEFYQGRTLIEAARDAGVGHFVQATAIIPKGSTASIRVGAKQKTEEFLRGAGLPSWTILRPGFFMENLPTYLAGDRMVTGFSPDAVFGLIAADDIGAAAVSAAQDPERFNGETITLIGDVRDYTDIGRILSQAWGRQIDVSPMTDEEAIAAGLAKDILGYHRVMGNGAPASGPDEMRSFGLQVTQLPEWAAAHQPEG